MKARLKNLKEKLRNHNGNGEQTEEKNSEKDDVLECTLKAFRQKTYRQYRTERRIFVLSTLVYGLVVLLLAGVIYRSKPRVILVPPQIKEKLSISYNDAGEPYYKEMALYLSQLVGNLSPQNARYAVELFASYLEPSVYEKVRDDLLDVVDTIERKQVAFAFYPRKIGHVDNRWYVVGDQVKLTSAENVSRTTVTKQEVTYEMHFKVIGFRLYVTYFKQLSGDALRKLRVKVRKASSKAGGKKQ